MIAAGVGFSDLEDTCNAALSASGSALENSGSPHADFAFVFATSDYCREADVVLQVVRNALGCEPVIGCSAMGLLTTAGEVESGPGLAVLAITADNFKAIPFLASNCSGTVKSISDSIYGNFSSNIVGDRLLVLLPDVLSVQPSQLVEEIQSDAKILPIVGAASSVFPSGNGAYHWDGFSISRNGASGALLCGDFQTKIGVAQGCDPIGDPLSITRAKENIIAEIDGRPALKVLSETLAYLSEEELKQAARNLFAGIAWKDEYNLNRGDFVIRNLVSTDQGTGTVGIAEEVREGQIIQFQLRNAQTARSDMHRTISGLFDETRGVPLRFGLYFNCLGRGAGLYGEPNHDLTIIKEFFGDLPIIGFFGNAEIAPLAGRNYVHNYTGVLVLVGET